eukprot:CAMPEP_0117436630 /NCGR_PEP_ID=MMETSP0759-20121206/1106_1 /TAXON_ID=63605 /ORGANISM="Percolomonas cosmopolitus, Strain WS" /LENGTH=381 /DNA_ID=CAMNT_0005228235 /DNA_START=191 /DNA_END=1339 /DNA_ORIENTATION=-
MLYDASKFKEINATSIIQSWREANVYVAGMQRVPDENEPKLMNLYLWSDVITLMRNDADVCNDDDATSSRTNYDLLFEYLNHAFIARYIRNPSACLKFCKLKIIDEVRQKQTSYQLDSQFLDTTTHVAHNSVGIILNLCHSSTPFKWPVIRQSGVKADSSMEEETLQNHPFASSRDSERPEQEHSKPHAPRVIYMIVCDSLGMPYTADCEDTMKIFSEWNDGLTPRTSKGDINFQWLQEEYGIEIQDELESYDEGTVCQTTPFLLTADPPTNDYVHDMFVYIFEGQLKREPKKVFKDWKGALRDLRKQKNLFLNAKQWKKFQDSNVYLPATSQSLMSIMRSSSESMKQMYAETLGVDVKDIDNCQLMQTLLEQMLREKMKI